MSKETQIKSVSLGYLTSPSTFIYRQGASLQVTAGVVPCITAPVEITVTNQGRKRLVIPKHSVIAEVYPFDPNFTRESPEPREAVKINTISGTEEEEKQSFKSGPILHEQAPFNGGETDTVPKLPPISENEALPEDLQDIIKRDE